MNELNIHKTQIEWATHVWNPITGCNHGCRYCYAKRIIDRFAPKMTERPEPGSILEEAPGIFSAEKPVRLVDSKGDYTRSAAFPKGFNPMFYRYQLDYPIHKTAPCRVFVVAMGDMFGEWVPDEWIEKIFEACSKAPQPGTLPSPGPESCPRTATFGSAVPSPIPTLPTIGAISTRPSSALNPCLPPSTR